VRAVTLRVVVKKDVPSVKHLIVRVIVKYHIGPCTKRDAKHCKETAMSQKGAVHCHHMVRWANVVCII
jgi:hypothetical protein